MQNVEEIRLHSGLVSLVVKMVPDCGYIVFKGCRHLQIGVIPWEKDGFVIDVCFSGPSSIGWREMVGLSV